MTDINPGQLGEALNWKADRDLKNLDNTGTGFIIQTGTVIIWPGTTVPDGYLLCDGSAISRTTYAALFAVIGTTYGPGDSSGTFNLPNFTKERIIIETYKSGTSWYHVYSDGWCEQGGLATGTPTFKVSFLKPFRDANYTITTTTETGNGDYTVRTMEPIIGYILANSCTLQSCPSFNGTVFYWQACGYITLSTTTTTNQHIIKY